MSPRRARQVVDLIRGKKVDMALQILDATPRAASEVLKKTLQSAVANAVSREGSAHIKTEDLVVKTALVDGGPMMKRFLPRAMGRATRVRKRMSHITIVVSEAHETGAKVKKGAA